MDRVIATSPGVAVSCGRLGVSAGRTRVIPPGITADIGQSLSREAIAARVGSARPAAGFLDGEPMAERVDELLAGFGETR
jgi:hypothetical protein